MSDEEKKAIENLRKYLLWIESQGFSKAENDKNIEMVLNLIEKQQAEIEKKDIKIKNYEQLLNDLTIAHNIK